MTHRFFWLLPLVVWLALAQPVLAASPLVSAEIDPRVLEDLSSGSARLIVRLKSSPALPVALSPADLLQDRGLTRVAVLRSEASAAQANLLNELQAQGRPSRSYWIVNSVTVEADRTLLEQLAARSDVLSIESDRYFQVPLETPSPSTTSVSMPSSIESGLSLVKAPALWALGVRGQGMVVASADTGVEWQHPALIAHYRGWNGSTADHNANWWDAIHSQVGPNSMPNPCGYNSKVPCDDFGHGTHTTGTMVGSDGAAHQIGMAPDATWIACRNMDRGWGSPSTYIECLQFFIAPTDLTGKNPDPTRRPHVIDNSYGCPPAEGCQSDSLQAALQEVRAAGIFMSASAGNDGPACGTIVSPPANDGGVFTVGGVRLEASTQNILVYSNSSRGPVSSGSTSILKPDLAAPAVDVTSSYRGGSYASLSGTSMAAPHVAGGVALLWSAVPSLRRKISETEELLRQTAKPLPVTETCGALPASAVPNNTTGSGMLNVTAAFRKMMPIIFYFPLIYR